jgi:hypothetical protein
MAEGLAEPQPALPQQSEAPLMAVNGHHLPPPSPASVELPPPVAAPVANEGGAGASTQFSPSSASAFENLREMLGKLRQPNVAAPAPSREGESGSHTVAARLATVMSAAAPAAAATAPVFTATQSLPAPMVAADPERDALLGRYEALRMQMSAEAVSLPLDYTKLAELIRLAGRRFPLVRFSEHELPGMTGRYAMCWSLQGMEIVFGLANFADSSYWRTLAGFAAGRLAELNVNAVEGATKMKIATFKTDREQQSWAILQHSTAIPEVLRPHVDVIHLDTNSVASLYAMQRIIKESESGALQATPAQVMSVLARELDFFWKRVTRAA